MKITVLLDIENQHDMKIIKRAKDECYSHDIKFDLQVFHSPSFDIPRKSVEILEYCNCTVHVSKTSLSDAADIILIRYLISVQKSERRILVLSNDKVIHTAVAEFNDDYNIDVFNTDSFGDTLDDILQECSIPDYPMLMIAARRNDLQKAKELIKNGCDVDSYIRMMDTSDDEIREYCNNSLLIACENGYADLVKLLVSNGANLDISDESDYTPLMISVSKNYIGIVELLLGAGANANSLAISGYRLDRYMPRYETAKNALSIAIACKHEEIVSLLLRYGANTDGTYTKRDPRLY
jgi:ankyrin repeat protein